MTKILILGGSGFIGHYVVKKLAEDGCTIKIISKNAGASLKVCGEVGQIIPISGNILDEGLIEKHTLGMDVVINLVGILNESYSQKFDSIHNIAARNVAKYAKQAKVKQLIHFSALGVEVSSSNYSMSKLAGEGAVKKEFFEAVIIRPSVVFGNEDIFFNRFGRLISICPFLPLVGSGKSLMQPVYVVDVANFVHKIIDRKIVDKTYEIAGPSKYSFKELMQFIIKVTGRKCFLLNIPFPLARFMGWLLGLSLVSFLLKPITATSKPILTRDQVNLLKYDNISDKSALPAFGINPTAIEKVVPNYLRRFYK